MVRRHPLAVWRDPAGHWSGWRIAVLLLLLAPAVLALYDGLTTGYGPRPLNELIHRTGFWALMVLMAAVAVTPLRRIARFNSLIDVRRMIGVGAFVYAAAHISLYVADQGFDLWRVASEIVQRYYLTIGFVTLLGLAVLTVTSTDGMVRRLGVRRWQALHSIVYGLVALTIVHYFQQIKADPWAPTLTAALLAWLMLYRILVRWSGPRSEPSGWALLALTIVVSALTFLLEAAVLAWLYNAPMLRVLQSAFEFDWITIRPGWFVLAGGIAVSLLGFARVRWGGPRRSPPRKG